MDTLENLKLTQLKKLVESLGLKASIPRHYSLKKVNLIEKLKDYVEFRDGEWRRKPYETTTDEESQSRAPSPDIEKDLEKSEDLVTDKVINGILEVWDKAPIYKKKKSLEKRKRKNTNF